jgi:hypothetical protein
MGSRREIPVQFGVDGCRRIEQGFAVRGSQPKIPVRLTRHQQVARHLRGLEQGVIGKCVRHIDHIAFESGGTGRIARLTAAAPPT